VTGKLDNDLDKTLITGANPNDKSVLKKKDLVKLTGFNSVGLVLDISKDYVKILDISGKIRNESNYSINTRIDTRKFVSKNSEGSNITNNSNIIIK
jgi:transcription elongation factor